MKSFVLTMLLLAIVSCSKLQQLKCHPECSWKCDDPKCDAICTPVCEPPRCHSSCQEPKNAVCDVKCEKPNCQIMCPDKACEMDDCPKCVTICKEPHCVTHCQVPKPECEAICEEPKCDWKCQKPQCPKPKCELVCENPNCRPKVECCNCNNGGAVINTGMPMFKEMEKDDKCCQCDAKEQASNTMMNMNPLPHGQVEQRGFDRTKGETDNNYVSKETTHYSVNPLPNPVRVGPSYYEKPTAMLQRIEAPRADNTKN